jgi:type IV pilus assembly protein PilW
MQHVRSWSRGAPRRRHRGMTLIELMVALAIGAFLMIGAVTVFLQSRTTFRLNETVARLQENGRFVLDALEPDIRMASYWGLTTRGYTIRNRATPTDPPGLGPQTCGTNWAINLERAVEGTNGTYTWACSAFGTAQPNADTLVVRRASETALTAGALTAGTLYVQSHRALGGELFSGTIVPTTLPPPGAGPVPITEIHPLVVNGYYVSRSSALGEDVPSLRRKRLAEGGRIVDEEVLPGVEDFQVQFGVDTTPPTQANRGAIDRYVNPGDPIITPGAAGFLPDAEILAVRIWVRLRAERPEIGYTDTATYVYADREVGPFNDGFRRLVVSKTIYLRNARPPS